MTVIFDSKRFIYQEVTIEIFTTLEILDVIFDLRFKRLWESDRRF